MSATWNSILRKVQRVQERARKNGYPLWYRGHRLSDWTLQSSLHRRVEANINTVGVSVPAYEKVEIMRDAYKSLYRKFNARAWGLLSVRELSDWGIIFSMQHHGIPTRLLDWTESFVCALYFAHCERKSSEDAAIFILSPEQLNLENFGTQGQVALGEDVIEASVLQVAAYHPRYLSSWRPLHTIAVAPVLSNPRMLAQQSTFTLCGDPFQPLDQRYKNFVMKIVLPAETFSNSAKFLRLAGVGHFGYFPDLDGLRKKTA